MFCHDPNVTGRLRGVLASLIGRRTRLRWVYLILGGALLMPYFFVALVAVELLGVGADPAGGSPLAAQFLAYLAALPLVAATGFFPMVRTLQVAAVRALLGVPIDVLPSGPSGPAVSWQTRRRTAGWFVLHLAVGGLVGAASIGLPPAAALLLALPVTGERPWRAVKGIRTTLIAHHGLGPLLGLATLAVLFAAVLVAGAGLARLAPRLLGPSATDRLAALQRRSDRLAERNRLARELHDSVGHALSIVTVQAGAAGRVLDRDPGLARQSLTAIEQTARNALSELDHVLGLLREEPDGAPASDSAAPRLTLADLDRLLGQAELGGVQVRRDISGQIDLLPAVVSREAYRIVQESMTNAVRHAGGTAVSLRVEAAAGRLELEITNPLPGAAASSASGAAASSAPGAPRQRANGGSGLRGIEERVAALGGNASTGPVRGEWRVRVELPL